MSHIRAVFKTLKRKGRRALIPFITAGDPDLETTKQLIFSIEKSGGDILELGVPFSDPLADGPTIQASSQRALKNGVNLEKILALVEEIRPKVKMPIVLMSYYNPLFRFGLERLADYSKEIGVDGLIIPDLPVEEGDNWLRIAKSRGIDTIFLVAPTTSLSRAYKIARKSTGFIYYVSLTGVTGARERLPEGLIESLTRLRKITKKPIAVGFGISSPEHIKMLTPYADGLIVGSAIVRLIERAKDLEDACTKVSRFVSSLADAL